MMVSKKQPAGVFGVSGPLVLLFSPKDKIRDVITVGLMQCNYQVIQAQSAYVALIKASQMQPQIILFDVSGENPKDILLAQRLQRTAQTRHIAVLLIVSKSPHLFTTRIIAELTSQAPDSNRGAVLLLEYPFTFAALLDKIRTLSLNGTGPLPAKSTAMSEGISQILFDPAVPIPDKFAKIEGALHKHFAFPFTVVKAYDILASEESCAQELSRCIATDPAISSAILKIANSVLYSKRQGRITDVKDAVVRIGFRETRNILACLSLINLSPEVYQNRGFERRKFWLHSLAVGLIAEKLCHDSGFRRPELGFIAGLLHDLGKIMLDNHFDDVFPRLLDETMTSITSFYESEEHLMGFTHAELGHFLTTQWNFPPPITSAILSHHAPERILQATPEFNKIIQEAVYVANLWAKALNLGHSCDEILLEIPGEILRDLKIEGGPARAFFQAIHHQLNLLCSYLNLSTQDIELAAPKESSESDVLVVYDEKEISHPLVLALRNNGFRVRIAPHFDPATHASVKVIIVILERGLPIDIMLYGDESEKKPENVLKIFLVDMHQYKETRTGISDSNILFIDRNHLDVRMLLHTLDAFFGQVIVASQTPVE